MRAGAPDVHLAVPPRRQHVLGTGGDADRRSLRAVGKLVGNATRRREVGEEGARVGGAGPATRRGVIHGAGEEEAGTPRAAAHRDDVTGEHGVRTIERVVHQERPLVHPDVSVQDS